MGSKTLIHEFKAEDMEFDLRTIDDNAFDTTFFEGVDLKKINTLQWFQFCKANKAFGEPGISEYELAALHNACEKSFGRNAINIVETGMCYGVTTRYFLIRNLKYGGTLTNFEVFTREKFEAAMRKLNLWQNIIRKGHSMKDHYEGGIDMLWIDSEHALEDALGEYMRFRVWLNGNAVIGFHDTDCCPGVAQAIKMIQEVDDLELIEESTLVGGAGCQIFKMKNRNRTDRDWNNGLRK